VAVAEHQTEGQKVSPVSFLVGWEAPAIVRGERGKVPGQFHGVGTQDEGFVELGNVFQAREELGVVEKSNGQHSAQAFERRSVGESERVEVKVVCVEVPLLWV
jgi:hypothetical protein